MRTLLKVENVKKKFGELTALENVNFDVVDKECLGIIGPNGAGKTTLFNVISGYMKPTEGRVEFMGKDITGKRPSELAKLGLVRTFQLIKAFMNMSVEENFKVITDDYRDIMKDFDLWSKRDMLARNLSQGDLRKLNIGLALATNPKLLLLDEPFSGLSPKECSELHSAIDRLKERGVTMIVIEHKLKELFNHVERVIVLNYGVLLCQGTPEEIVRDIRVIEAYLGDGYAVA